MRLKTALAIGWSGFLHKVTLTVAKFFKKNLVWLKTLAYLCRTQNNNPQHSKRHGY